MSKFSALFKQVGNAKPPAEYTDRLLAGTHKVALERFEPKVITKKNNTQAVIVEAEFTVIESTVHQPGETKGWTWFPGDEFGYQDGRIRAFIESMGACIGDTRTADVLGEELSSPNQPGRGIVAMCTVVEVLNKDGTKRLNEKGAVVTNSNFTAMPQTLEQVSATRKELDGIKPLKLASEAPAPTPKPEVKPAGQLLGMLGKR